MQVSDKFVDFGSHVGLKYFHILNYLILISQCLTFLLSLFHHFVKSFDDSLGDVQLHLFSLILNKSMQLVLEEIGVHFDEVSVD